MIKTKRKFIMFGLLFVLCFGNTVYAANDFFWSETEYLPACGQSGRDGSRATIGYVIDGKRIETEVPTCEEAKKTRVLVRVNGKYLHTVDGTGAEPYIENGRTMIPLRAVADAFGFEVEWEAGEGSIQLIKDGKTIVATIGKPEIQVDGETVYFEGAVPVVKEGRTFLPAGKLAELLGIRVQWDGATRTATFTDEA